MTCDEWKSGFRLFKCCYMVALGSSQAYSASIVCHQACMFLPSETSVRVLLLGVHKWSWVKRILRSHMCSIWSLVFLSFFVCFSNLFLIVSFHYHLVPSYNPPHSNHHIVVHVYEPFFPLLNPSTHSSPPLSFLTELSNDDSESMSLSHSK